MPDPLTDTIVKKMSSLSVVGGGAHPKSTAKLDALRVNEKSVQTQWNQAKVFEKAHRLVDKHQQRAESIADEIESSELRRLFYYLIDTVLERPDEGSESPPSPILSQLSVAEPRR